MSRLHITKRFRAAQAEVLLEAAEEIERKPLLMQRVSGWKDAQHEKEAQMGHEYAKWLRQRADAMAVAAAMNGARCEP